MIAFLLSPIGRLVMAWVAGAAIGFGGAWTVQGWRLDALKSEYSSFKGGVAALGEQAKAANAKIALGNLKAKERADEENLRTTATLRADIERLRHDRDSARGSFVPAAPAAARRPDLACFDRDELESAIRELVVEVRGLTDQGDAATLDLNTAKRWAAGK